MSAPVYTDGLLLAAWEAAQAQADLHVIELGVLLALARHSDQEGRSWPSTKNLAQQLRIKYQHAAWALQGLERRGLISTTQNARGLTVYLLMCLPKKQQAPRRRDGVLSLLIRGEAAQAPAPQRRALRLVAGGGAS